MSVYIERYAKDNVGCNYRLTVPRGPDRWDLGMSQFFQSKRAAIRWAVAHCPQLTAHCNDWQIHQANEAYFGSPEYVSDMAMLAIGA